jgi:hypothetical protein
MGTFIHEATSNLNICIFVSYTLSMSRFLSVLTDSQCDPDFPCSSAILPSAHAKSVLNWLRPCEISNAPQLFLDGIDEGDVIQGMLGDCYLLSGLCVISGGENNEVENIFLNA